MSGGSDSGAQRAIPSTIEEMVRQMYHDLSVSRPGRPCVVDMLARGEERMDRNDEEIARMRELQNGHDASIAAVNRALELHCITPTEKPVYIRMGESALMAMAAVVGAALPVALAWGLLWQSSQAMRSFQADHYTPAEHRP